MYAGANWHERETHEMFGIEFAGHPDLRNMYLPTEFEGFPLRKDFPLLARMVKPWPGIVDVEPMPAEDAPAEDAVVGDGDAGEPRRPTSPTPGLGDAPAEDAAPTRPWRERRGGAGPQPRRRAAGPTAAPSRTSSPTHIEPASTSPSDDAARARADDATDAAPAPPSVDPRHHGASTTPPATR